MRQARILSIEDNPQMRLLLQLIFERKGHRVVGVRKGEIGLELLRSLNPDVLLLDLMLPDIDGWDLYQQMKADNQLSQVPVIIVSARNEAQDAARGYRVIEPDRFVQKPFDVDSLVTTVEGVLQHHFALDH